MLFTTDDLTRLETLRRELATAQATLRDAEYAAEQMRVRATDDILTALGDGDRDAGWKALGSNEAARAHRLALELCRHESAQTQARLTRAARARVETLDAEMHTLTDRRRFAEWETRDRLAAALLARGAALLDPDAAAS